MGRKTPFFKQAAGGAYTVDYSCIFNGSDEDMDRTPSVAGSRTKWTFSTFYKRSSISTTQDMFDALTSELVRFNSGNTIVIRFNNKDLTTSSTFTDTSNWHHLFWVVDTTASTASDRNRLFIDGSLESVSGTNPGASENSLGMNTATAHWLCSAGSSQFFAGKLCQTHFVDGYAKSVSDFASGNLPIEYTGEYGTNGFFLDYTNSSDLGEDAAGSNDYTPANMDATNQSTDVPS